MDISQLPKLGKIAGVPGIALGAVVLVLGAAVAQIGILPEGWRGPVMVVVVIGAILLAALSILGWIGQSRGGKQIATTEGDDAAASNVAKTKSVYKQLASTKGANAPASNVSE